MNQKDIETLKELESRNAFTDILRHLKLRAYERQKCYDEDNCNDNTYEKIGKAILDCIERIDKEIGES